MIAASIAVQRPAGAKLLVIDGDGNIRHTRRSRFVELLKLGDLVIANDAATIPASLTGLHVPSGSEVEVRLAGRGSLAVDDMKQFLAVVFGAGDFHTRTEDRSQPPPLAPGDRLILGSLKATVASVLAHPRFISLRFDGLPDEIRDGLARHGRPIQYAHLPGPLHLWDVWTPVAGPPVAFEPPSAGFALDWRTLSAMAAAGVRFATITHAAGISSTGDPELDALLPFDEPYHIPNSTARAILYARAQGGRIIAVGTTVVRGLEHAAAGDGGVRSGAGVAHGRITAGTILRVVDAILSGTHEQGTSHYELLRSFADDATLARADEELNAKEYRTHEFGDSVFIERKHREAGAPLRTPASSAC
jgi:S-adenosylmethionine:tRNA ribosyltransferase-isomerase